MASTSLSVVVPVLNDPEGIDTTLESLTVQTIHPDQYEVLAVDNGSTDHTADVIRSHASEYPDIVQLLEERDIRSSYAARNQGIRAATGKYIAFLDADMHVDTDWAESVMEKVGEDGWRYMGCHVEVYATTDSIVSRYSQMVNFPIVTFVERANFAPTCSLVVDAGLFDELGPFDDRLVSGGDIEFGHRVHRAGIPQHVAEDITVFHPARSSLVRLLKRGYRVGRGFEQLSRRHPDSAGLPPALWKTFVPPRPRNFAETISGEELSFGDVLGFYGLDYLAQVSRGWGRLSERLHPRPVSPSKPGP